MSIWVKIVLTQLKVDKPWMSFDILCFCIMKTEKFNLSNKLVSLSWKRMIELSYILLRTDSCRLAVLFAWVRYIVSKPKIPNILFIWTGLSLGIIFFKPYLSLNFEIHGLEVVYRVFVLHTVYWWGIICCTLGYVKYIGLVSSIFKDILNKYSTRDRKQDSQLLRVLTASTSIQTSKFLFH